MIQDLVIKLDENKQPLGTEVQSPPLLYANILRILPNASLSTEKAIPNEVEQHGYGVFEWAWEPKDLPITQSADPVGLTKHSDGVFRPTFIIREATQQEIDDRVSAKAFEVRTIRNFRLSKTDITQLPQATEQMKSKVVEWEQYREALRNITAQPGFPFDIQWPIEPEEFVL